MKRLFGALAVLLPLAAAGCIADPAAERKQAVVGECTILCNATGAWEFDDGQRRWINDIWMKPEGLYARERGTDSVMFYKAVAPDKYRHEGGGQLELATDNDMTWIMPSGRAVRLRRHKDA